MLADASGEINQVDMPPHLPACTVGFVGNGTGSCVKPDRSCRIAYSTILRSGCS